MISTPSSVSSNKPLIDPEVDDLNKPFERVQTLEEVIRLYLKKADSFHIDQTSGGKRERTEQFIKFLVTLASPEAF